MSRCFKDALRFSQSVIEKWGKPWSHGTKAKVYKTLVISKYSAKVLKQHLQLALQSYVHMSHVYIHNIYIYYYIYNYIHIDITLHMWKIAQDQFTARRAPSLKERLLLWHVLIEDSIKSKVLHSCLSIRTAKSSFKEMLPDDPWRILGIAWYWFLIGSWE